MEEMENIFVKTKNSCIFAPINERRCYTMLIIPVKEGENIDRALKRYKRKFDRVGIVRELRSRQHFSKPSVLRRNVIQRAEFIQRLRDLEEI
ncbi:30S ribosomal protein S21 [Capnocytophaga sp. oral taxon 338 str. F0234]|nr:30S ribosomal protein S21 [Capnocytophaga sp. oral taxon 338 str. F0234]